MTSPAVSYVTEQNFEQEVVKSDKLVLISFSADWCGPCKAMAPVLAGFAEENKDNIKVVKVNVDASPRLSQAFGIRSVPTLVAMKDGQPVAKVIGALSREELKSVVAQINQKLAELDQPQSSPPPAAPKKRMGFG